MRLMMVRHGATPNNVEARFTGQTDVAMSALGERQADALARRLAAQRFDLIVSSDLIRAHATAQRIARLQSCELRLDSDLREVSMGAWEGLSVAEAQERYNEQMRAWQRDAEAFAPPEGESLRQFAARIQRAMKRWGDVRWGERVLLVTHGGVIGVALCLALGLPLAHRRQFGRDNTSITELQLTRSPSDPGRPDSPRDASATESANGSVPARDGGERLRGLLVRLNDTAHLEGVGLAGEGERSQVL